LDEADQVIDFLVKRKVFVVVSLVGVDGCVSVGSADGVGHFRLYVSLIKTIVGIGVFGGSCGVVDDNYGL